MFTESLRAVLGRCVLCLGMHMNRAWWTEYGVLHTPYPVLRTSPVNDGHVDDDDARSLGEPESSARRA